MSEWQPPDQNNPYASPAASSGGWQTPPHGPLIPAVTNWAVAPGICLLIFAILSIPCNLYAFVSSGWVVFMLDPNEGVRGQMNTDDTFGFYAGLGATAAIGLLGVIAQGVVIAGSICMIRGKGYRMAKTACIVAVIPCIGPCCIVGIPFGLWGLTALNDPGTKAIFGVPSR